MTFELIEEISEVSLMKRVADTGRALQARGSGMSKGSEVSRDAAHARECSAHLKQENLKRESGILFTQAKPINIGR